MGESDNARPHNRVTSRGAQGSAYASSVLTPPSGLPADTDPAAGITIPAQRTGDRQSPVTPPVAPPAPPAAPAGTCTCGHAAEAHEHYRAGDDCGACGPEVCAHYRPADAKRGRLRRLLRR